MDLIAIDIGNSNVSLGVFIDEDMRARKTVEIGQIDGRLGEAISSLRAMCPPQAHGASTVPVVVCSVNPPVLERVEKIVGELLDQRVLLIGRDVPTGMKLAIEDAESVGSDRLVAASAAYDFIASALVVADFGTATTIDCVSDQGIFLGGSILPGIGLAARCLNENTACLPAVTPDLPDGQYGTNTISAIQHGVYYGAIGALRELIERYATELGKWPHVVLTGGYADMIANKCDFVDSLMPGLPLMGIYLEYVKFRTAQAGQEGSP